MQSIKRLSLCKDLGNVLEIRGFTSMGGVEIGCRRQYLLKGWGDPTPFLNPKPRQWGTDSIVYKNPPHTHLRESETHVVATT